MKKNKVVLVSIIFIIMILGGLTYCKVIQTKSIVAEKIANSEENKNFIEPEYNKDFITSINNIDIKNDNIKNKYEFVFISDLHASIIDENEPNEEIRNNLKTRNEHFFNLNEKHVKIENIFEEIIDYTNNKKANALLLGGDIIDVPANSNLEFLRNNLSNLQTDYLYTFGNHDWTYGWNYQSKETEEEYYPKFKEFMKDTGVSYLEYEDLVVLAINDSKNQIDAKDIPQIKKVLELKKPTIVMMHVPIATEYIANETKAVRNRVSAIGIDYGIKANEDTKKALELILSENYNVFYVISGHTHFEMKDTLNDRIPEFVSAPAYEGKINVLRINK